MDFDELLAALLAEKFKVTKERDKSTELHRRDLSWPVYLKNGHQPHNQASSRLLVIHPSYLGQFESLNAIPGVGFRGQPGNPGPDYYHSASLAAFPKRKNAGVNPIHYGVGLNVSDHMALRAIIRVLEGTGLPLALDGKLDAELEGMPPTTRQALIDARIGQGQFRKNLIQYWDRCAVTGVEHMSLLFASHIKPWRDSDNRERLCTYNGLLLSPSLDRCFDAGIIGFDDHGHILFAKHNESQLMLLGIGREARLKKLEAAHLPFLRYHRAMHDL